MTGDWQRYTRDFGRLKEDCWDKNKENKKEKENLVKESEKECTQSQANISPHEYVEFVKKKRFFFDYYLDNETLES